MTLRGARALLASPGDVYVDSTPEDFLKGRDAQIEKAVEVLKGQLAKN